MEHHFNLDPRPPRPYREHDHDPSRDRPVRGWNVVWALLILIAVTGSVQVDAAAATAELRHDELRGQQRTICERLPDGAAFADVFDLGEPPRLSADDRERDLPGDYDRSCDWKLYGEKADRQLAVVLDDAGDHPDSGLGGPRLALSGLAETAELAPPYLDPAGGVSLYSRNGDTAMTVTVVDQTDIEGVMVGATNGSFPYRRLITAAVTATAEAWTLLGHSTQRAPLPSPPETDRLPRSLCERLDPPDPRFEPVTAAWPPNSEAVGKCEWRVEADDVEVFYVRVDTAPAIPAADTNAAATASWLWDIRDPEVGDTVDDLGPDSAIGFGAGMGGVYFRASGHLIQIFHKTSGDEDASRAALLRTARQLVDELAPRS